MLFYKLSKLKKLHILVVIALLINLVAIFANPSKTQATLAVTPSDTLTRLAVSTAAGHDIRWTMSASETFATAETIILDFNEDASGFVLSNDNLAAGDIDMTVVKSTSTTELNIANVVEGAPNCTGQNGANDVAVGYNDTTGVITILACGSFTASDTATIIDIEIGETATNGSTGTNRLTNPGSAGSTEINVTGTHGDDAFAVDVPIMDSDQVTVTASVDTTTTFDIDIADGTAADSNTPYSIALGELTPTAATNQGTSGVSEIYLQLASNASGGVVVQVKGNTGTLSSASTSDSIDSTDDSDGIDTSSANGEWGLAAVEDADGGEGILDPLGDFDVYATANAVGEVTTSFQDIFDTDLDPVASVYGEVAVRAIAGTTTAAATDYTETLTFIATATY